MEVRSLPISRRPRVQANCTKDMALALPISFIEAMRTSWQMQGVQSLPTGTRYACLKTLRMTMTGLICDWSVSRATAPQWEPESRSLSRMIGPLHDPSTVRLDTAVPSAEIQWNNTSD